jgi:serine/threonine protein kinase
VAVAAAQLGEPSIRPIVRLDPRAGLLVMPQAAGPSLRTLIRPPGMLRMASRARALVAFMLEGIATAHRRGLVHGWLLPSQIMSDAAGRPLVGPFGAHHLSGLAATHTGGLEEIMMVTAPELRAGGDPTPQSDLYAVGAILRALLTGRLSGAEPEEEESPELERARGLTAVEPDARPDVRTALRILRTPVADVRELDSGNEDEPPSRSVVDGKQTDLEVGIVIQAADTWSDALLDALCRTPAPWLQPVLDREQRMLVLAAWPEKCRTLGADSSERWRNLLSPAATSLGDPELEAAIEQRLGPTSLVRTPSGDWMVALDDLLSR